MRPESLVEEWGLTRIDFLSLHVEGSEEHAPLESAPSCGAGISMRFHSSGEYPRRRVKLDATTSRAAPELITRLGVKILYYNAHRPRVDRPGPNLMVSKVTPTSANALTSTTLRTGILSSRYKSWFMTLFCWGRSSLISLDAP
jgi:hypothetical protein